MGICIEVFFSQNKYFYFIDILERNNSCCCDCFELWLIDLVEADTARAAVQAWVDGAKVQSRAVGDDLGDDRANDLNDRAHNLGVNNWANDVLDTVGDVVVHVLLLDLQVHDWLMVVVVVVVDRLRSLVGVGLDGVVN